MPITPVCILSDCFRAVYCSCPNKRHCIYHHQLFLSTRIPLLCLVPFCFNKCKVYGPHSTCVKHAKYSTACCIPRCDSPCLDGSHVCASHLEINYCAIPNCSNIVRSRDVDLCQKHTHTSLVCCFEDCILPPTPYTSFCMTHYKHHRLCSTYGCFSPIFRNGYCCRHLTDPNVCFALRCRISKSGDDGLCAEHSTCYTDCTPPSLLFDNFDILLDDVFLDPLVDELLFDPLLHF